LLTPAHHPAVPHRSDHCIDALLRLRLLVFMQFERKSSSNIHSGASTIAQPRCFWPPMILPLPCISHTRREIIGRWPPRRATRSPRKESFQDFTELTLTAFEAPNAATSSLSSLLFASSFRVVEACRVLLGLRRSTTSSKGPSPRSVAAAVERKRILPGTSPPRSSSAPLSHGKGCGGLWATGRKLAANY
jgi:hypothetical protein